MKMPKPIDVKGVQRILGLVNNPTEFLSNLSDICEPIRRLTHKESAWEWTFEQDETMESIKKAVCNTPVLKCFNSKEETTLQCDSSQNGMGAVLMQKGQPVAFLVEHSQTQRKTMPKLKKNSYL